jgi:hypothetical protein
MRQVPPKELRPNCLLTRYPICFMHGLKSIFHFRDYWHGIPEFLAAHGYDARELHASWRGPNKTRLSQFAAQLDEVLKRHEKVHVIAHSLATLNILELCGWPRFQGRFASVTLVSPVLGGTPWAELSKLGQFAGFDLVASISQTLTAKSAGGILEGFKKPDDLLIGSIISIPRLDLPRSPKLAMQHRLLTAYLKKKNLNSENDGLVPVEAQRIAKKLGPIFHEFPGDHMQIVGRGPWPAHLKTAHEMFLDHCIFLAEYCIQNAK